MKTEFTPVQLADPDTAVSAGAIRKCVHCGFCTATCPTYVLLGDELDSPRGRIYLIKNMLEQGRAPTREDVRHIDRCLSCMACTTTCPSGVDYMHLVDHARSYIEENHRRPLPQRLIRALVLSVLPHPGRFRVALHLARWTRGMAGLFARITGMRSLGALLRLAPRRLERAPRSESSIVQGEKGRVVLLQGCAEPVLRPRFREATMRLLNRLGYSVVLAREETCCGAMHHHAGNTRDSLDAARRNIVAWEREIANGGLDAILTTASGCGTTLKDYGHMLREDAEYAERARNISALVRDVSEFVAAVEMPPPSEPKNLVVAYHAACSLQHAQKVTVQPVDLLRRAGFTVVQPDESHLCCGSAGTYNILQPELAEKLGERKVRAIERLEPDVIATGNIGCAMQIAARSGIPVVHTVELLDWASGGPCPMPGSPSAQPHRD